MGTLTITTPWAAGGASLQRTRGAGNFTDVPFTFAFSTSYATNGETVAAASMPAGYKDLVSPWAFGSPGGLGVYLDVANSKVKFYASEAAGSAEISNATNLQTVLGTGAFTVWFRVRN